jgi:hypothetical protein
VKKEKQEDWNDGTLEYWARKQDDQSGSHFSFTHSSNVPLFHYSCTQDGVSDEKRGKGQIQIRDGHQPG